MERGASMVNEMKKLENWTLFFTVALIILLFTSISFLGEQEKEIAVLKTKIKFLEDRIEREGKKNGK